MRQSPAFQRYTLETQLMVATARLLWSNLNPSRKDAAETHSVIMMTRGMTRMIQTDEPGT